MDTDDTVGTCPRWAPAAVPRCSGAERVMVRPNGLASLTVAVHRCGTAFRVLHTGHVGARASSTNVHERHIVGTCAGFEPAVHVAPVPSHAKTSADEELTNASMLLWADEDGLARLAAGAADIVGPWAWVDL